MSTSQFRERMDEAILLYAAKKLSEIRPEVSPTREEGAAEPASGDLGCLSPDASVGGAAPRADLFDARYRVPRSQVWEGSRGRQSGHVHLYVKSFQSFDAGRIHRKFGQALCGVKPAWYDRAPMDGEQTCPRCAEIAARANATLTGEVAS